MGKFLKLPPVLQYTGPRTTRTYRSSTVPKFRISQVPGTGPRYSSSPRRSFYFRRTVHIKIMSSMSVRTSAFQEILIKIMCFWVVPLTTYLGGNRINIQTQHFDARNT